MDIREQDSRTAMMLGVGAISRLAGARVAVFGIGGVGGHLCEALARAGVGAIDLIDSDTVALSNLNRQIVALHSTLGRPKVEVMRDRILDINPDCNVRVFQAFYLPENADEFDLSSYDFVIDAIDTVSAKIELAVRATRDGVPFIACMGTGNKLYPELLEITDLSKTSVCPLARVMRRELKARGIEHVTVLYSPEKPIPAVITENGRHAPASTAFVPAAAGLMIAAHVVRVISKK